MVAESVTPEPVQVTCTGSKKLSASVMLREMLEGVPRSALSVIASVAAVELKESVAVVICGSARARATSTNSTRTEPRSVAQLFVIAKEENGELLTLALLSRLLLAHGSRSPGRTALCM